MPQLTVYRASAGSGKTFRLAVEYIKCLIQDPKAYETILAVTFTNKATEEMKMRILSTLYGLSRGLPDADSYMERIVAETGVKEEFVRKQAGEALDNLLHNYSYFRVETIDRFFQTVLRNLARELDLTPNLRVELGSKEIEYQAVDELINSLKADTPLMNWIIDFIHSTMDENHSWNIIGQIKKFGEQLLTDDYKALLDDDDVKDIDYKEFMKTLRDIQKECVIKTNELGGELIKALGCDPLTLKKGKTGVGGFISKMATLNIKDIKEPTATAYKAADDVTGEVWVTKKDTDELRTLCIETIRPMFAKALKEYDHLWNLYNSCRLTLQHISELRLLEAIDKRIKESNQENNRFLLSDTQTLLHGMIDDSDSPFIYEKIGSHLRKIMIDEFQDTSVVQWQNFKVLLSDCMSHGTGSLIVGDVKQSIYRWRSGDWRLLNNIKDEFPEGMVDTETLGVNYRSCPAIVNFNNSFFSIASKDVADTESQHLSAEESDMLRKAYSSVEQNVPSKKKEDGYVEVLPIPFDKQDDYDEKTYVAIAERIKTLRRQGVSDSSIAIIVRSNFHISDIADYLTRNIPDIHVVSDEAFRLDASDAVMIMIDAMRLIANPDDAVCRARLACRYQHAIVMNHEPKAHLLLHRNIDDYLPEGFSTDDGDTPLYQLAEKLYNVFGLSRLSGDASYVCTLFDSINDFVNRQIATLPLWLEWWDEKICSQTIESVSDNGLRIISIHKSKGLEYDHVICPFMDWTMNKSRILWAKPETEPFNMLKMIPLDYNKHLTGTIYEHDYRIEHLQNAVDDLNLLYVAFTRASKSLFITTCKYTDNKSHEDNRSLLIMNTIEKMNLSTRTLADGTTSYTFGEDMTLAQDKTVASKEEANVFDTKSEPVYINKVEIFSRQHEFRQSNDSVMFTTTDEEEQQRQTYIQLGNILHYVFQNIRTADDVDSTILKIQQEGLLSNQDITAEAVRDCVERCLGNPDIRRWFSDGWEIYNECTILDGKTEHRPDRVIMNDKETIVIDFKLSTSKPQYKEQVRRYMDLLQKMGHRDVKGYLLYMLPAKTEKV